MRVSKLSLLSLQQINIDRRNFYLAANRDHLQRRSSWELAFVETMATARASLGYGGWYRPWGSAVMVQIYRIIVVGVLCSQILLASLDRTPYEVNTFTS